MSINRVNITGNLTRDPEVRTTSGDVYPQVKTYVFGLSITF